MKRKIIKSLLLILFLYVLNKKKDSAITKIFNKKTDNILEKNIYIEKNSKNTSDEIKKNYKNNKFKNFSLIINDSHLNIPLFNMRSIDQLSFFYNFHVENISGQNIQSLNMIKDINEWMDSACMLEDDFPTGDYPVYLIVKDKEDMEEKFFEVYKLFINKSLEDSIDNSKTALIVKGDNYENAYKYLCELIENHLIIDILENNDFVSFDLNDNYEIINFLTSFLSFFIPNSNMLGKKIIFDISNSFENHKIIEYFYNSMESEKSFLNTVI